MDKPIDSGSKDIEIFQLKCVDLRRKQRSWEADWSHKHPCNEYILTVRRDGIGWCKHVASASARRFKKEIMETWAIIGVRLPPYSSLE